MQIHRIQQVDTATTGFWHGPQTNHVRWNSIFEGLLSTYRTSLAKEVHRVLGASRILTVIA